MSGRIRRLWTRDFWGKLVVLASFGFVGLLAATAIGVKLTEGNRFCGYACHEMVPYAQSWQIGKHQQVDCVKCHIPPGLVSLAKAKLNGLHEVQVHFFGTVANPIKSTGPVQNAICQGCHDPSQLAKPVQLFTATFNHQTHVPKTGFCDDCHAQVVHQAIPGVTYIPPQSMTACFTCHDGKAQPNTCAYCHTAPHPNRGACQDCHNLQSWVPGNFHHPVPLIGPHANILCEQCHTSSSTTAGTMGPADGCVNCHGDHHNSPLLTTCANCHTTTHFVPSTFVHKQVGPHVPSGETPLACSDCHTQTLATATCSCHGGNPPTGGG